MTGIDDIEYFRKARAAREAAPEKFFRREYPATPSGAFDVVHVSEEAQYTPPEAPSLEVLVRRYIDAVKEACGFELEVTRRLCRFLEQLAVRADAKTFLLTIRTLFNEGNDGATRNGRLLLKAWEELEMEGRPAIMVGAFTIKWELESRYYRYEPLFLLTDLQPKAAPRVGGSREDFIRAMKEQYMPLFHEQVSMGVDVALPPVRREVIPTSPGIQFRPIIKGPYKRLTMDCRDGVTKEDYLNAFGEEGPVSKIPGAQADWAPSKAVTYEPDFGEDLEISTEEERAWRAKR